MSVSDSVSVVSRALTGKYAVAAINTQGGNYDIVRAIVDAAEEEHSPIIIAAYEGNLAYTGFEWFAEFGRWLGSRSSVPVVVHLDHAKSVDSVRRAVHAGFTSVMIDFSTRPIEENIAAVSEVIEFARAKGVSVEAEIGELQRNDEDARQHENRNMVDPGEVKHFLSRCRPDMLAIGIGNAHGFYKGEPDIRLDLLEQVHTIDPSLPLVLHGTTGIPADTVRKCVAKGMAKVNYGTVIRYKYLDYVKEALNGTFEHKGHMWRVQQHAKVRLMEDVRDIIRLLGSTGKA